MRDIIQFYGEQSQIQKAIEELNELIEALNSNDKDNILEEIADCIVMIKQLQIIHGFTNHQIDNEIDRKVVRTRERMRDIIRIKGEINDK